MGTRTMNHELWMQEAIKEANSFEITKTGGPFGAVIVKENQVIAKGRNLVTVENDPTAHAEVVAIRHACKHLNRFSLQGCTLYTSCEPCPMCLAAIYWARIDKVYFACNREDAAKIDFDDDFLYHEIPKPIEMRKIPFEINKPNNALEPFHKWQLWNQKIRY